MTTNNAWNYSTTPIAVSEGGTAAITLANNGLLLGTGTSAIRSLVGTTGTLVCGNTGADPTFSNVYDGTSLGANNGFSFQATIVGGAIEVGVENTESTDPSSSAAVLIKVTNASAIPSINIYGNSGAGNVLIAAYPTYLDFGTFGLRLYTSSSIHLTNPIDKHSGGTARATLTSHGVLFGNGATDILPYAELINGQTIIGQTYTSFPLAATITAGTGIKVTNASGSITLDVTNGAMNTSVIGTSQSLASNYVYFCTTGTNLSLALPTTSVRGDMIIVSLDGSTSWTITQATSQQIIIGTSSTTIGTGGSLASTAQGNTVIMVCQVANLKWVVQSQIGTITVT